MSVPLYGIPYLLPTVLPNSTKYLISYFLSTSNH